MIILGLDPALINIGWSLVEYTDKNNFICIDAGCIKVPKNNGIATRLNFLHRRIINLISHLANKYQVKIDVAGVEESLVNSNPKSSLHLAMARGVILSAVASFDIKIFEFHPRTIKRTVANNGNANKEEISKYIKLIYGSSCPLFATYDVSDALAIAYVAANDKITKNKLS